MNINSFKGVHTFKLLYNYAHTNKQKENKMSNDFLTRDIKISTDSAGAMTAKHKFQGLLVDSVFYASRKECRTDAVDILKEMKEMDGCESYEAQERRLEREENAWRYQ